MGHREELLAGAKQCLYERGYARTTARDIIAVSGANLASIGYHFGSKEALLTAALIEATEEWAEAVNKMWDPDPDAPFMERFESLWKAVVASLAEHRNLWVSTFEALNQAERLPELKQRLSSDVELARVSFAQLFGPGPEQADERADRAVGAFYVALMQGVMVQRLLDPERAPTGEDIALALRTLIERAAPTPDVHPE
ncbi:TetR/AcrR family transcriptional regulator [Allokutzneria sp. A3M-2-11 16]|uniref:TetR/AcrR family transcriptional regulator n=1 Tax=Allokutzneria sp. A3M-2-11 16 TaxID=2962043 RepID=UPI0020B77752|nr:TetR/AcrR family transcriptional regulator [Allokutzneria sp. A3M-2-11 16]MCP3800615.1 TetR/AcrR family transcriptional regulator [Allokutzneria sp. A3M-2-11 16]